MTLEPADGSPGVRVLRVSGDLDVLSAPALEEALTGAGALVLDLSEVTFFDSAGVRLLDRLARSCAARGDGFRVVAPPGGRARRVLQVVGLLDGVVDDVATAVAQVQPASG